MIFSAGLVVSVTVCAIAKERFREFALPFEQITYSLFASAYPLVNE